MTPKTPKKNERKKNIKTLTSGQVHLCTMNERYLKGIKMWREVMRTLRFDKNDDELDNYV